MSQFVIYDSNETIIEEASINLTLYFLIRGSVDIFIGKDKLASFRGGGRIFGEMSFVNHTTTSASVIANTEVVMLEIQIDEINKLDESHERLKKELYRSVAEILSQKLMATNDVTKSLIHKHEIECIDLE
jgi:CRP-like cAMP-binding protein